MARKASPPDRALLVGRFQPFHLGHLHAVKDLANRHAEVIIGIGSAQASHTPENPYTAGERMEMVLAACHGAGLRNVIAVPLIDMFRNAIWVSHVVSQVPAFRVFASNNPLPVRLFQEAGYETAPAPFHDREKFEAKHIRRLMLDGGDWQALVPPEVAKIIERVGGVQRLKDVLHGEGPREPGG